MRGIDGRFDRRVRLYLPDESIITIERESGYRHRSSAVALELRSPATTAMQPVIATEHESGYRPR